MLDSYDDRLERRRAGATVGPYEYKSTDISDAEVLPRKGRVVAYAARIGTADRGDRDRRQRISDVIQPGAFVETLGKKFVPDNPRLSEIIVPYAHDLGRLVGHPVHMAEDEKGLVTDTQYNLKTFWGSEVFGLIEAGDLSRYSIGWLPERSQKSVTFKGGNRLLHAVELFEYGPHPLPMHPGAHVLDVKGMDHDVSFGQLVQQASNNLMDIVVEVEGLIERRGLKGRAVSREVTEAILELVEDTEASIRRLRKLASGDEEESEEPEDDTAEADVAPDTEGEDEDEDDKSEDKSEAEAISRGLSLSLQLAKARARQAGVQEVTQ